MKYTGYLSPHLELIRAAHARGEGSGAIARELYLAGARARSSEPYRELTPQQHIENLRMMALYALQRLGLRARKSRHIDARRGGDGVWLI